MSRLPEGEPSFNPDPNKEGGSQHKGRIYQIPPELRDPAIELRTAIIQGIHKLQAIGKFPSIDNPKKHFPVGELFDRLKKSCPILSSYVLRTMTDEEWENYVLRGPKSKPITVFERARHVVLNTLGRKR